jgi:hypothetical protein
MQPIKAPKEVTKEDIQKALPSRKGTVTDEIVELINKSQLEPEFQGESLLQTATTYEQVLTKNKASIKQYLNAIRFCSYLISMDDNFTEAYKKTFTETDFVKARLGLPSTDTGYIELASAASRYRRSKLVVDILTISQVPMKLLFRGMAYEMMGVLHGIAHNGKLDRDRVAAAKTILETVKDDENVKIELDVGVKENSAVTQLNEQLAKFANDSLIHLQHGTTDLNKLGSMKTKNDEDVIDAEVENG